MRLSDTSIDPPEDAWRAEGVTLAPGERLVWTYDVTASDGAFLYGCSLKMQHTAGRRAIFGDAQF